MTVRLIITPAADRDLEEIAAYLGQESVTAADRFMAASETAFVSLLGEPGIGARFPVSDSRLANLRRRRMPQFGNYLVFYRVTEDAVQIVRVLHGARDLESILSDSNSAEEHE